MAVARLLWGASKSSVGASSLVVAMLMAGCQTIPLPPRPSTGSDVYRVRCNDLLSVSFLDEPQLTQQVRVDWQGRIELPWLMDKQRADLTVAGKTPPEIALEVARLAARNGILKTPRASVLVTEYSEQTFVIQGQVLQPGRYLFPRGYAPSIPLPEAVALSGGCTRLANVSCILVRRGDVVYKLSLQSMLSRPAEMFYVTPGDLITVGERLF